MPGGDIELSECSVCGVKDPEFSNLAVKDLSGERKHIHFDKVAVCSLKCLHVFTNHYHESKKRGKWDQFLAYYKIK